MRCKNCGWPNEDNVTRCVKCNAPLQGSMIDSNRNSSIHSNRDEPLKTTLREPSSSSDSYGSYSSANSHESITCPQCGYPISAGMSKCPVCHAIISPSNQTGSNSSDYRRENLNRGESKPNRANGFRPGGTINPWATPSEDSFCTLQRIPWHNEHVNYDPVSYSGETIILHRSNTDANNNSITSKEQAVITHENGEWYIENKSDLQTTLVRVDRKMKLEDGDVIVLGNRMFEFRKG